MHTLNVSLLWHSFFKFPFQRIESIWAFICFELNQIEFSRINTFLLYLVWNLYRCIFITSSDRFGFYRFCEKVERLYPRINFQRNSLGNIVRFIVQSIYLLFFCHTRTHHTDKNSQPNNNAKSTNVISFFKKIFVYPSHNYFHKLSVNIGSRLKRVEKKSPLDKAWLRYFLIVFTLILTIISIVVPFDTVTQLWFSAILWAIALWLRSFPGNIASLIMMILSIIVSSRYIWWRMNSTLNWDNSLDLMLGFGLLLAELYTWLVLVLGFLQAAWPLNRKVASLPENQDLWPTVDIYIPTYNEPLSVLKPTVFAAQKLDWPTNKINIYVLDDGKRESIEEFCLQANVNYMTRPDNSFAKAGNLNHAMKKTNGEFITIFDCDHIPVRSFLQLTIGGFIHDKKLALVQTPHHFFSPDPFERNLNVFRESPNEGELFYGSIQDGNDLWNATFFCGSCAVLRRDMLTEIGGIATETVTEDAHTALKLHRLGYNSAYINIKQAAGLATESVSAHIGQRIRWARGMLQIFRLDNPLLGRGLKFMQRICYSNAMLHFFYGLPRLVFLTAPLAFLLLHSYIIFAPVATIFLYVIPAIFHANLINARQQGKYRNTFWAEMYESILAWYIFRPTLVALINPKKGKFNVTEKGGLIDKNYFDWVISTPYLILILLNLLGICFGVWRIVTGPEKEIMTVMMNIAWTFYNLLILGGVIAVATESKQIRKAHRVYFKVPVSLLTKSGHIYDGMMQDYSESGLGISIDNKDDFTQNELLQIIIERGDVTHVFDAKLVYLSDTHLGLEFTNMDLAQQKSLIESTFSRGDSWLDDPTTERDQEVITGRLLELFMIGIRGYKSLIKYTKSSFESSFPRTAATLHYVSSYLPKRPSYAEN